mmetsp:Transcript_24325/g.53257  ORF Transcript_24325/g.53257 Transcript_24325/m.53257 type:complete len:191 (-) Transcript_24325:505-1077(-)
MTDCQPFAIGRTTIVLVAIVVVAATATIGLQQSDAATAFASSSTTSATTTATTTIGIPAMMPPNEKHPLEDHRSWNLHLERHFGGGSVEPNTDAPAETTNRRPSRRRMARAENKFVEIKENETITVPDLEDDAADDDDDESLLLATTDSFPSSFVIRIDDRLPIDRTGVSVFPFHGRLDGNEGIVASGIA